MTTPTLLRALLLCLIVACSGSAMAQDPQKMSLAELEALGKAATVTLSDGRMLTYQQLDSLPKEQMDSSLRLISDRISRIDFKQWQLDAAKAREAEADRNLEALKARNAEKQRHQDAIKARVASLDEENSRKLDALIGLWERGAVGDKCYLKDALVFRGYSEAVKARGRALLANPSVRWLDHAQLVRRLLEAQRFKSEKDVSPDDVRVFEKLLNSYEAGKTPRFRCWLEYSAAELPYPQALQARAQALLNDKTIRWDD